MLKEEDYFLFGKIFKTNGYKGEVSIYNSDNIEFNIEKTNYFLINKEGILTPYFIETIIIKKNAIIVKFEDINSKKDSLSIIDKNVFLLKEVVREKPQNKKLINYKIIDNSLGEIGFILNINNSTLQKLIIGENKGKKFFIPLHDKFLLEINHQKRYIKVNIPKELLELN